MKDKTESLRKKFSPHHRYANFGPVIRSITVQGFRGITHPRIEFTFPITAFSGLNGAALHQLQTIFVAYEDALKKRVEADPLRAIERVFEMERFLAQT